jgi:hypothetical protein
MRKPTNKDHFDLREVYEKETGVKAFEKETYIAYINWLEKRLVKRLIIQRVSISEA